MKKLYYALFLSFFTLTTSNLFAFGPQYQAAKNEVLGKALQFMSPRSLTNTQALEALETSDMMHGNENAGHQVAVLKAVADLISHAPSYAPRANPSQSDINYQTVMQHLSYITDPQCFPLSKAQYAHPNNHMGALLGKAFRLLSIVTENNIRNPGQEKAYLEAVAELIFHSGQYDEDRDPRATTKVTLIRQIMLQAGGDNDDAPAAAAAVYSGGGAAGAAAHAARRNADAMAGFNAALGLGGGADGGVAARPQGDGFIPRKLAERKHFRTPPVPFRTSAAQSFPVNRHPNGDPVRRDLRHIFSATKQAYLHGYALDGQAIDLGTSFARKAIRYGTHDINQKYGYTSPDLPPAAFRPYDTTDSVVVNAESFVAAKNLLDQDSSHDIMVMDMANQRLPGGGVYEGSSAQEEDLSRQSNLQYFLDEYYDRAQAADDIGTLHNFFPNEGGLYIPEVKVFRTPATQGYKFINQPWKVAVGAVAGYNIRRRPGKVTDEENYPEIRDRDFLYASTKRKIEVIFDMAFERGHDTLILGALGCGAFGNDPVKVAEIYHEVLTERAGMFRKVVFAVLITKPTDTRNFDTFNQMLTHNFRKPN